MKQDRNLIVLLLVVNFVSMACSWSIAELLLDSNKKDDYAFTAKGSEIAEGIDDVDEFNNTEVILNPDSDWYVERAHRARKKN